MFYHVKIACYQRSPMISMLIAEEDSGYPISSVERENSGLGELEEGEKGRREEERIYLF